MSTTIGTASEPANRAVFLMLLRALSRPGSVHHLGGNNDPRGALATVAGALLHPEATFHTPDLVLRERIVRIGGRLRPADVAEYHFHLGVSASDLAGDAWARVGRSEFSHHGGTLVVGCELGTGTGIRLHGPGIEGSVRFAASIPAEFWELRNARLCYPHGWDVLLIDGDQVVGVPGRVEVAVA